MAPNIAIPIVKPIALATLKMRESKRLSGIMGSLARRSRQTNMARKNDAYECECGLPSPEPHRYWFPPQVVTMISALTPPASNPAPR